MGATIPKQYLTVAGTPILRWTIDAFASHPNVDMVQVAIHPKDRPYYDAAIDGLDILNPVAGGASRQESVRLGLESLMVHGPEKVLIHDGARPFPDAALINRVISVLDDVPAALAALPVSDTLKREAGDGFAGDTVERTGLWRAQTPQGFRFPAILDAHRKMQGQELTDDAAVAEGAGLAVKLVAGSEENFKVTEPEDIQRAERHLGSLGGETRVGTGFDVHRFGPGNQVTLCGVSIPHDQSLAGHSDADVAMHALTDAILGAIGAGDIGVHFPPTNPQWKGAPSHIFLAKAGSLVTKAHGNINNLDVTIICEAPKIAPHQHVMAERVAEILKIDVGRVSVKATTTECLGFTGRGEGIAAQATATIRLTS